MAGFVEAVVGTVSVAVPVPPAVSGMLAGVRPVVRPAGDTVAIKSTVSINPCRLVSAIFVVAVPPWRTLMDVELAVMLKSRTWTVK